MSDFFDSLGADGVAHPHPFAALPSMQRMPLPPRMQMRVLTPALQLQQRPTLQPPE